MNQQVWLFRHGLAEKKSTKKEDFDRALTPKGRKELAASVSNLRYLLDSQKPLFIWSSPLPRAFQTAEIITQAIGKRDIVQKEFLATGDFHQLTKELTSQPQESILILVGHEPSLSAWAESLSGFPLPFEKGSCAAFQMKNQSEGDLLWFHQPASLKNLGTNDTNELFQLRVLLLNQLRKIQSFHEVFLQDPNDENTVHQLRVSMRQFRGMLSFLKPLFTEDLYQKASDPLKEAFHQFSHLREFDVLIEEISTISQEHSEVVEEVSPVLAVITAARQKEKSRLVHSSNRKKIRTILNTLIDWTESIDWAPLVLKDKSFAFFANKRIKKKHKQLKKTIQQLDYTDVNNVHAARIEAKEYHYMVNHFSPFLNKTKRKAEKPSKKLQKQLSKPTDTHENILTLTFFLNDDKHQAIKEELQAIIDYQNAQLEKQLTALKHSPLTFV